MKKSLISLIFIISTVTVFSQSSIFVVVQTVTTIQGEQSSSFDADQKIKVTNLGSGKYSVRIKDNSMNIFKGVTVKYKEISQGLYIYTVVKYDNEFKICSMVASSVKLSEMVNGKKGNILYYFDSNNSIYFMTKL